MVAITLDAHLLFEKLKSPGLPEQQAEKILEAVKDLSHATYEAVAKYMSDLKDDLKEFEYKIELKIDSKLDNTKAEIFKRVIPLFLGQYALLIGLFITLVIKFN